VIAVPPVVLTVQPEAVIDTEIGGCRRSDDRGDTG
jgi:hypothetical protein